MRRIWLLVAATALGLLAAGFSAPSTVSASPTAKKYSSCRALNTVYPNGVALSAAAARKAVVAGWRRPTARPAVYRANRWRVKESFPGLICGRLASNTGTSVPKPAAADPLPAVTNLTVVPNARVKGDVRATFTISWQMPAATPVQSYVVTLLDGSNIVVAASSGVSANNIVTYAQEAHAPFGAIVRVTVAASSNGLNGPVASRTVTMPGAPERRVSVQFSAGQGSCGISRTCIVTISNATGSKVIHYTMGSWVYEVPTSYPVSVRVSASTGTAFCQIRLDGVVADTETSDQGTAFCYATTR